MGLATASGMTSPTFAFARSNWTRISSIFSASIPSRRSKEVKRFLFTSFFVQSWASGRLSPCDACLARRLLFRYNSKGFFQPLLYIGAVEHTKQTPIPKTLILNDQKKRVPFKNCIVDAMHISLHISVHLAAACPCALSLALRFIHILCYVYSLFRVSRMQPFELLQRTGHCDRQRLLLKC